MNRQRLQTIVANIIATARADWQASTVGDRTLTGCALDLVSLRSGPQKERRELARMVSEALTPHEAGESARARAEHAAWLASQPAPVQVNRFASLPYPYETGNVSGWITRNPRPGCAAQFVARNDSTGQIVEVWEADVWTLREWAARIINKEHRA